MKMIKKSLINYQMLTALIIGLSTLLFEMAYNLHFFSDSFNGYKACSLKTVYSVYALSIYSLIAGMFPALPYSFSIADEKRSGVLRLELIRYGYRKYIRNKILAVGLSGMISTLLPYTVVVVLANLFGSHTIDSNTINNMEHLVWRPFARLQNGSMIIYLLKGVLMALFGILWAELALLISLYIRNRYIAYILPFIIYMFLHVATINIGWLTYSNPRFMIRYDMKFGAPLALPFALFVIYILITIVVSNLRFRRMVENGEF